jgi:hypothetical protein
MKVELASLTPSTRWLGEKMGAVKDEVTCFICGTRFETRKEFWDHRRKPCKRPEVPFYKETTVERPNITSPPEEVEPMKEDDKQDGKTLEAKAYEIHKSKKVENCPFCGYDAGTIDNFDYHVGAKHVVGFPYTHPDNPYKCPNCPLRFETKGGMGRHISGTHRKKERKAALVPAHEFELGMSLLKNTDSEEAVVEPEKEWVAMCLDCVTVWKSNVKLTSCPDCQVPMVEKDKIRVKRLRVEDETL